jgi:hypothetical protein
MFEYIKERDEVYWVGKGGILEYATCDGTAISQDLRGSLT